MNLENSLGYHTEAYIFLVSQELEYIDCINYFKQIQIEQFLVCFTYQKEEFYMWGF